MPKYDYKCPNGHTIEIVHPITECDNERTCLTCGAKLHRVPAVRETYFWGPGFASTDHIARANVGRNPSNTNRYSKY